MKLLLETERLRLRSFQHEDAKQLHALDNDPEVMRYINGGVSTPFNITQEEVLPRFLSYDKAAPEFGYWVAMPKESHRFLGWFSFNLTIKHPRTVSLGYRLHKEAWGKGYATEGARALIHKGFTELAVECFIATTYEDNLASQRVLEKLGMCLVKRFKLSQEELDASASFFGESAEVWEGDELEYRLLLANYEPASG